MDHTPILVKLDLDPQEGLTKKAKHSILFSKDQGNSRKYMEGEGELYDCYKFQSKLESLENLEKLMDSVKNESTQVHVHICEEINTINKLLTNKSLEVEMLIKSRGRIKWWLETIQCQKDCAPLRLKSIAQRNYAI
jgi:hypothetical protein